MAIHDAVRAALLFLAASLASTASAEAAQPLELHSDVKVDKIIVAEGQSKHVLSEPDVVVPGDRLVFRTAYSNTGTQEVTDFVVTNPLPAGVALDPSATVPAEVSVDGGQTWGHLAALFVTDAAGAKRPAQASDVTHVRWVLKSVKVGEKGEVTFNAIVR